MTQAVQNVEKKSVVNIGPVERVMKKMESAIITSLPKHISHSRFSRIVTTSLKTNPKLAQCSPVSIISSVMLAAQIGLEPNTFGQCYLIPYYNSKTKTHECQFQIGYKGMVELVRRSGHIQSINCEVIYEHDDFEITLGIESNITHKPKLSGDRGAPIIIYSIAKFKDGGNQFDFMTVDDIRKHKERFSKANYGPWVTDFLEMGKKTVLKRLCKMLPLSAELFNNINQDESIKHDVARDMTDVTEIEVENTYDEDYDCKSEMLADQLSATEDDGANEEVEQNSDPEPESTSDAASEGESKSDELAEAIK